MARRDSEDTLTPNRLENHSALSSKNSTKPSTARSVITPMSRVESVLTNPDLVGMFGIGIGLFLGRVVQSVWKSWRKNNKKD